MTVPRRYPRAWTARHRTATTVLVFGIPLAIALIAGRAAVAHLVASIWDYLGTMTN